MIRTGLALAAAALTIGAADPLTAELQLRDAERFAALFERTGGMPDADALQREYLDGAGEGVTIFTPGRIENAANLARSVAADRERYAYAIRTCLPIARSLGGDMRAIYLGYRGLVPERPLPQVHLVFGAGNSGGTANSTAQVLGLEVLCGPGTTADQFRTTMRTFFAHETVHSWQREPKPPEYEDLLLFYALREGVPDYLAGLVTGQVPEPQRHAWASAREAWLWAEFQKDRAIAMGGGDKTGEAEKVVNRSVRRWFGNYQNAPAGWPHEAGYWIGMRIAERYVAQAADKQAAIRELIDLSDPPAILAASGYQGGQGQPRD